MLRRALGEPLLHFLAAGALLFVLAQWMENSRGPGRTITVDRADLDRLAQQWEAQYGSAPTPAQREALLRSHIQEEILYREALQLGLDRDDVIIRRRLVQKLRFLTEGLSELTPPSESELREFYRERRSQYARPAETSFQHIYFATDDRGERSQDDARAAVRELNSTLGGGLDWRSLGDPSILQREYARRPERDLSHLFGSHFVQALRRIDPGPWTGPIPSIYGWHVVRVHERSPKRIPKFSSIRETVAADWLVERRTAANESLHRDLGAKYEVDLSGIEGQSVQ